MKVSIEESESNYIERLYFEYEAGKTNIAFLMAQKDIRWEVLQHYVDVVETRFVELEKAKKAITDEYLPDELVGKEYNYQFVFEDNAIEYTEAVK